MSAKQADKSRGGSNAHCSGSSGSARFGSWVRSARDFHGLSLDELAVKSGVSKGHLSDLENGLGKNPAISTAAAITGAFGMPLWRALKKIDL